jgi:archaeoflavoprotein AfpA
MSQTRKTKRKKIAWGITGAGEKLLETFDVMKEIQCKYQNQVEIRVYLSRAGQQVVAWYKLLEQLKQSFGKISVETSANSPFLAGALQMGRYDFLLIAPATSNTVAKIASGIADSLLSNSAIMALKAFVPVYVMPTDYEEGTVVTKLNDGRSLKLSMRKEDVDNVAKLRGIKDIIVLESPEEIREVFEKHFDQH